MTISKDFSENVLTITSQDITASAGDAVTQGSITGTLKAALSGATIRIAIETVLGVIFEDDADVLIGTTTVVHASITFVEEIKLCNICLPGFFTDVRDLDACQECPAGYYDHIVRRNRCEGCPRGRYGNQTALETKQECKNCTHGRYSDIEEVAQMLKENLKIAWIDPKDAEYIDRVKKWRTTMPDGWKWGENIYERLDQSGTKYLPLVPDQYPFRNSDDR